MEINLLLLILIVMVWGLMYWVRTTKKAMCNNCHNKHQCEQLRKEGMLDMCGQQNTNKWNQTNNFQRA